MIINEFIKELVETNQITTNKISELSGYSVEHIEDIVNKKITVSPNEAYKILKVLGCDLGDVLEAY